MSYYSSYNSWYHSSRNTWVVDELPYEAKKFLLIDVLLVINGEDSIPPLQRP